jgi:hypothetical protein
VVRIEFVGSPPNGGRSRSDLSIMCLVSIGFPFPWKRIWRNKAPLRVTFFVWMTTLGEILMLYNLRKRHVIVTYWCCMCKKNGAYIDHLLLYLVFWCHTPNRWWS